MDLNVTIRPVNRGGGTDFVAEPQRLRLGGQGAENVDRICFALPEAWTGLPVSLYVERADGSMSMPLQLDTHNRVLVTKAFTRTEKGKWMLVAMDGEYQALTRPGTYDCYATLNISAEGEEITPSQYEQFVAQVIAYAVEAEASRTEAAGSASAAAAAASQAGGSAAAAASCADNAAKSAREAAASAAAAADSAEDAEESAREAAASAEAAAAGAATAEGARAEVAANAAAAAGSAESAASAAGSASDKATQANAAANRAAESERNAGQSEFNTNLNAGIAQSAREAAAGSADKAKASAAAAAGSAANAAGSAADAAASAAQFDVAAIIAAAKLAAKEEAQPVGCVVTCYNVPGGPDLSTPEKYAEAVGFGVWEKRGEGRALMGTDADHAAGTTAEAGLPNIEGALSFTMATSANGNTGLGVTTATGAFAASQNGTRQYFSSAGTSTRKFDHSPIFDASRSNAIYGASDTVQPPALFVYIYQRVG